MKNRFPYECKIKDTDTTFIPIMIDYENEMVWRQLGQASENGEWYGFDEVYFSDRPFFYPNFKREKSFK